MEYDFRLRFNKNRQFVEVYLWAVHPNTFSKWKGGRWGYWTPIRDSDREGKFGEIHFVRSRLRFDTIIHELEHFRIDYIWSRGDAITRKNEEKYTTFLDEVTRKFLRELRKIQPGIRL